MGLSAHVARAGDRVGERGAFRKPHPNRKLWRDRHDEGASLAADVGAFLLTTQCEWETQCTGTKWTGNPTYGVPTTLYALAFTLQCSKAVFAKM